VDEIASIYTSIVYMNEGIDVLEDSGLAARMQTREDANKMAVQ
jgi:hypothetical protein